MKNLISFFLVSFLFGTLNSQTVYRTEEFDFPGQTGYNTTHVTTYDGGAAVLCWTYSATTTSYFTLVKTQSNGIIQWTHRIIAVNADFRNIVQCPDSGYFFCYANYGDTCSFQAMKYDKNGNQVFSKRIIAPANYIMGYSPVVLARNNGNFYIASTLFYSPTSSYNWNLFEISASGNYLWSQNYNTESQKDYCFDIDTSQNGDIMLLGSGSDAISSNHGSTVDRISPNGSLLWSKKYLSNATNMSSCFFTRTTGDYFNITTLCNNSVSYTKIDGSGNVVWSFVYTGTDLTPMSVISGRNNTTYIIGQDNTYNSSFVLKIDSTGLPLCARRYAGIYFFSVDTIPGGDLSVSALMAPPDYRIGLITMGTCGAGCMDVNFVFGKTPINTTVLPDSGVGPISFVIVDSAIGTLIPLVHLIEDCNTVNTEVHSQNTELEVFPQPANDYLNVVGSPEVQSIELMDARGQIVRSFERPSAQSPLYVGDLIPGMYFLHASSAGNCYTQIVIILH